MLDEIAERHADGPGWAAEVIRKARRRSDPFKVVMDADSLWQAHRLADSVAAERAWERRKAEYRAAAPREKGRGGMESLATLLGRWQGAGRSAQARLKNDGTP